MTNASRCRKSKCFSAVLVAAFFLQGAVFAARWNDVDIKSAPVVQVESVTVEGEAASLLPPGKKWKLVWNDEFNGPEIDKTKWMCRESFWGADFPAFAHNFEGVEMTGRTMKLHLLRKGDDFTSPHLQTGSLTYDIPKDSSGFWPFGKRRKPLFMHKYGYYEIRCRQPKCPGWHSAFWLQAPGIGSSSDPGVCGIETDIMENYRQHTEGKLVGGNGWGGYGRDSRWFGHFAWDYEEMEDGWCYYGVDWSPNGYTFYANGKKVGEQNSPVSHVEQFILVSTEPRGYRKVGNDGGLSEGRRVWGKPDPMLFEAVLPDFFEVDFVRVYDAEACSATGGELEMRNIAHRGMWDANVPQGADEGLLVEETFSAALASEGRVDAAKCAAETSAVGGLSCAKGGVSKAEYLDLVEAAVSAYPEDHVAEYIDDADINGVHEHGFPRLAANLAALVSAGRHRERLGQLRRMMDICCRDAKKGPMEKEGNEFSVKELVDAIRDIEAACLYPKEVTDAWRRDISEVDPWRCYRVKPEVGDTERSYNWCVFGSASEQRRLDAGMGGDAGFVARYVVDQMRWFDSNGMWRDPHEPIVYDLVTRLQFALVLSSGYVGPARAELEAYLDRGAEVTLAMQSAAGEIPYGGRSNQFLHNDAMYAALCEWYAARALAKGDRQTAARFRSAAVRAVASLQRWLAERPVRHVKNRYPRSWKRGTGIGCENYAYFDKYMITMGSWAVLARRFADETPIPYVEESKAMSFATTPYFHFVFLRTGDYSAQFDYNADAHYDCDGLGRLHRRGAPTQICMSTPCAVKPNYLTETPNDGSLAIMPVGGGTLVPAGCGHDAESAWANWKVGGLDWKCRLTKNGLESSLAGEGVVALQLPAFAFDGECETEIVNGGKSLCISYRGWVCRYETNGTVHDTGAVCCNRNGRYRVFEARGKDSLAVTICIVKSDGLSNM